MNPAQTPPSITLACPDCHGLTRVPAARLGESPHCPRCKAALFQGHPVALDEAASGRYTHFVIASGDGRFAQTYREITRLGFPVTVVSRPESLAVELRLLAGKDVLFMPSLVAPNPIAA